MENSSPRRLSSPYSSPSGQYPPLPRRSPPPRPQPVPQHPVSKRARALEGFVVLGELLKTSDYFDENDCQIWQVQADDLARRNERLEMLRAMIPRRQQELDRLDQEYGLGQYFPEMMAEFVRKDARLQQLLIEEEEKERQRHVDFSRASANPAPPPIS